MCNGTSRESLAGSSCHFTVVPMHRSASYKWSLGAVLLAGGCAPAGQIAHNQPVVSSAGVSLRTTIATAYIESQTVSLALDRIDQHLLPLDQTYKHFGSGRGVTIYVFDGGILDTHPELAGRVRKGYDAFPDEEHICNAHGTAVAGAAAGATLGVAPDAEIVDVKMVECRKLRGTIDAIVRGTQWVLMDHARHPERRAVANWSFIADTSEGIPALDTAVQELNAAGIPVIVSAGNLEINACHVSPANSPGAIVVGASRVRQVMRESTAALVDERAPGTAYGPCVDVFAPGDSVLLPSMDSQHAATQQLWTGTSMAAGYVSGAAALYLEAHPLATTSSVTTHITSTASHGVVVDARSPGTGLLYVGPAAAH
jgi:subtilisin family serine protease